CRAVVTVNRKRCPTTGELEMDVDTKLIEFIQTDLARGKTSSLLQVSDDLIESEVLDSLGIMKLILFLEDNYQIKHLAQPRAGSGVAALRHHLGKAPAQLLLNFRRRPVARKLQFHHVHSLTGAEKSRDREQIMNFALTDTQILQWDSIVEFARRELNADVHGNEQQGLFPLENWRKCAEMGLLSLLTPEDYGGLGEDLLSALHSIEALSYGGEDSGLVHAIVTPSITEPDAGSDLLSMRTRVDGDGAAYSLSGGKVFISNGPLADLVVVFAKCSAGKSAFGDVSCFLIEKGATGYTLGKPLEKMGLRTLQN